MREVIGRKYQTLLHWISVRFFLLLDLYCEGFTNYRFVFKMGENIFRIGVIFQIFYPVVDQHQRGVDGKAEGGARMVDDFQREEGLLFLGL